MNESNGTFVNGVELTQSEKAKMFDEIAEKFYKRNFGQTSIADIELLKVENSVVNQLANNVQKTNWNSVKNAKGEKIKWKVIRLQKE
ncbi:MAG: hypothetical protein II919_03195 [Lachnospiraceae bacterium]|nr:hypothetical protein [Lachnospiraceae bacterium]